MSVVLKVLVCINADGQNVLTKNGKYELIADVAQAATARSKANHNVPASGYIIRPQGDMRCLSGVFDRNRFVNAAVQTEGDY